MLDSKHLKMLFDAGALREARIADAPMEPGYHVICIKNDGSEDILTIARTSTPRVIKTLDAARRAVEGIGFKEARLLF